MPDQPPLSMQVVLNVADIDPVVAFWTQDLGFREVDGWDRGADDRGSLVEVCPGGVVEVVGHGPSYVQPSYADDAVAIRLVDVADVDRRAAVLVGRGVTIDGPSTKPWGHWSASLRDPAGIEVVLFAVLPSVTGRSSPDR